MNSFAPSKRDVRFDVRASDPRVVALQEVEQALGPFSKIDARICARLLVDGFGALSATNRRFHSPKNLADRCRQVGSGAIEDSFAQRQLEELVSLGVLVSHGDRFGLNHNPKTAKAENVRTALAEALRYRAEVWSAHADNRALSALQIGEAARAIGTAESVDRDKLVRIIQTKIDRVSHSLNLLLGHEKRFAVTRDINRVFNDCSFVQAYAEVSSSDDVFSEQYLSKLEGRFKAEFGPEVSLKKIATVIVFGREEDTLGISTDQVTATVERWRKEEIEPRCRWYPFHLLVLNENLRSLQLHIERASRHGVIDTRVGTELSEQLTAVVKRVSHAYRHIAEPGGLPLEALRQIGPGPWRSLAENFRSLGIPGGTPEAHNKPLMRLAGVAKNGIDADRQIFAIDKAGDEMMDTVEVVGARLGYLRQAAALVDRIVASDLFDEGQQRQLKQEYGLCRMRSIYGNSPRISRALERLQRFVTRQPPINYETQQATLAGDFDSSGPLFLMDEVASPFLTVLGALGKLKERVDAQRFSLSEIGDLGVFSEAQESLLKSLSLFDPVSAERLIQVIEQVVDMNPRFQRACRELSDRCYLGGPPQA